MTTNVYDWWPRWSDYHVTDDGTRYLHDPVAYNAEVVRRLEALEREFLMMVEPEGRVN
jgi:hypothetical protein